MGALPPKQLMRASVHMDPPLTSVERIRAATERAMSPGFSHCFRCLRPWSKVHGHQTPYRRPGCGCFPLCEGCWSMLTPAERLPYYKQLWCRWFDDGADVPWEVIRAACLHEVLPTRVNSWEEGVRQMRESDGEWEGLTSDGDKILLIPLLPKEVRQAWSDHS